MRLHDLTLVLRNRQPLGIRPEGLRAVGRPGHLMFLLSLSSDGADLQSEILQMEIPSTKCVHLKMSKTESKRSSRGTT